MDSGFSGNVRRASSDCLELEGLWKRGAPRCCCFSTVSSAPRLQERRKTHPWGGKGLHPLSTVSYTYFLFFIEVILLPRLRAARFTDDWSGVVCLVWVGELLFAEIKKKKQYSRWLLDGKTCYFCSWALLIYVYVSRISDIKPVSVHKLGRQSYLWATVNFCLNPSVEAHIWITIFIFFLFLKSKPEDYPSCSVRKQHPTQIL